MSRFLRDLAERAIATYVQTFIGLLLASSLGDLGVSVLQAAAVGAIPAGLSVVKSAIAARYGDTVSPASLAPEANK